MSVQILFALSPAFQIPNGHEVHDSVGWYLCHDRSGIFHIVFNMLFLYWFGCTLEMMYGWREFLLFYLAAAVFAALALFRRGIA